MADRGAAEPTNALEATKRHETLTVGQRITNSLANVPGLSRALDLQQREVNKDPRHLYHNLPIPEEELDPETGYPKAHYSTNKVRTTKYTPLKFLPKNLFFQFQIVANIYFLAIAILAAFKIFGVDNPGLSAVPIIAIVAITAVRDGIEDWRRQVLDRELNNNLTAILEGVDNPNVISGNIGGWRQFKKKCSRFYERTWRRMRGQKVDISSEDIIENATLASELTAPPPRPSINTNRSSLDAIRSRITGGKSVNVEKPRTIFKRNYWKNVQVGHFIKIHSNETVPADIMIISTSESEGDCYIETRNLDGETNLKPRSAVSCTKHLKKASQIADAQFWCDVEMANSNLESFGWSITLNGVEEPLSVANFLPRGSTVRNTKWVIGYVLYTGIESKIMLNAGETPTKRSRLTSELNFYTFFFFFVLFVLSFASGLVEGLRFRSHHNSATFFEFGMTAGNPAMNGFVTFFAALIVLQNFIPISLYITVEIVRTIQAYFIWSDLAMYDPIQDYPCTPKTWSISDDLGQIEFIFSDKTGTLTQNSMIFQKCVVNDKIYGVAFTEAMAGNIKREKGEDAAAVESEQMQKAIEQERRDMLDMMQRYYKNPFLVPEELELVSAAIVADLSGHSGEDQRRAIELYSYVLAICNTAVIEKVDGRIVHRTQSPDEACLVSTARDLGYMLASVDKSGVVIDALGEKKKFRILQTLYFTSPRKRMSVLVEDESGRYYCMTKGADSVVAARIAGKASEKTIDALNEFGNEGLRTLLVAYREVEKSFAEDWVKRYAEAQASQDRVQRMEQVEDELEQDLILLGGTGIEDLLQAGVPDTIHQLGLAGIKLWVLTGDKIETAISIGYSSNLLDPGMELLIVRDPTQLEEHLRGLGLEATPETLAAAAKDHRPAPPTHAMIIEGSVLDEIVVDRALCDQFALLGKKCKSVLCCRVSPAQKAAVVNLMKNKFDVMTLAVGDGANDVSMIQVADVGVGIVGVEGRQAAMSSDYAIGQFRFLQRLILVHGRWSYLRVAELTANLLYKNIVFTMILFWYGIWTDMDQSYLVDYTYIVLFNSVFTSLPVVFLGCLDQDVPDYVCLAVPQLYSKGILRRAFNKFVFSIYALDGVYQSLIAYFFAYAIFHSGTFAHHKGLTVNYKEAVGVYASTTSILACNMYVLINQKRWDWLSVAINILSSLLVFAWTGIYTLFKASAVFYKTAPHVYGALTFWANLLIGLLLCLLPRFIGMVVKHMWFPEDVDIVQEQLVRGRYKEAKRHYAVQSHGSPIIASNPTSNLPSRSSRDSSVSAGSI